MTRPTAPSWRIRGYLAIRGLLCLWFAYTYVVSADRLSANASFDIVEWFADVETFAFVFSALAALFLGGALFPSTVWTRRLLPVAGGVFILFGLAVAFAGTWSPAAGSFVAFGFCDALLAGAPYRREDPS